MEQGNGKREVKLDKIIWLI